MWDAATHTSIYIHQRTSPMDHRITMVLEIPINGGIAVDIVAKRSKN